MKHISKQSKGDKQQSKKMNNGRKTRIQVHNTRKKQDKCNKKTTKRKQQQQQELEEEQNQVKPINLKDTKTLPSNRGRDVNSALALTSTAAGTDSALDVIVIGWEPY